MGHAVRSIYVAIVLRGHAVSAKSTAKPVVTLQMRVRRAKYVSFHDLTRLLERMYDAALDPNKWSDFLSALPQSIGMTCDRLGMPLFHDQREVPDASIQAKWSKKHIRQLALLTPHLLRAVEIHRAVAGARRSNLILGGTLDSLGRAVIVLDRRRKVLDANVDAKELMRGDDCPFHVDRFSILHAARCEDERALSASTDIAFRGHILHRKLSGSSAGVKRRERSVLSIGPFRVPTD